MACTDGVVSAYAADEAELRAALARHEPVIRLTSSPMALRRELLIDRNLTLQGGRHANIRIEADRRSRVLSVQPGVHVALCGLSFDGGHAWRQGIDGGAFRVASGASLSLTLCSVSGFLADNGGAVYVASGGALTDNNAADSRSVPQALVGHGGGTRTAASPTTCPRKSSSGG